MAKADSRPIGSLRFQNAELDKKIARQRKINESTQAQIKRGQTKLNKLARAEVNHEIPSLREDTTSYHDHFDVETRLDSIEQQLQQKENEIQEQQTQIERMD